MRLFSKQKVLTPSEITPDVMVFWSTKYPDGIFEFSESGKMGYFRKLTEKELEREWRIFAQKPNNDEKDATALSFKLIELSMLGGHVEILTTEPFKTSVLNRVGDYVLKTIDDTFPHLGIK